MTGSHARIQDHHPQGIHGTLGPPLEMEIGDFRPRMAAPLNPYARTDGLAASVSTTTSNS